MACVIGIQSPIRWSLISLRAATHFVAQVVQLGLMRRRRKPLFQLSLLSPHQTLIRWTAFLEVTMRNIAKLFLLEMIFSLALNGCGTNPSPAITITVPAAITVSPTLTQTRILPTQTLTPLPKGKTIVVTSAGEYGAGTLRQALQEARPGDTITFDPGVFPPKNPTTIALSSPLPEINQGNLTLDASNAGVILEGSSVQEASINVLTISSNGNNIRGLQIVDFPGTGIALVGGASNNVIGGDHNIGMGIMGQGNLVSGNKDTGIGLWGDSNNNLIIGNYVGTDISGTKAWGNANGIHLNGAYDNQVTSNVVSGNSGYGIELCCTTSTHDNILSGNRVGTDPSGQAPLGNLSAGVAIHDGASRNTIGPDNIIANNHESGIIIFANSSGNTITRNSIYNNGTLGIELYEDGNALLAIPLILDFDINKGIVTGWGCPNCSVEIFSDQAAEGAHYEGKAEANNAGAFELSKDSPFAGPNLTAISTDPNGNSSGFSLPTTGMHKSMFLQVGNDLPKIPFWSLPSAEIADNRIGAVAGWPQNCDEQLLADEIFAIGAKRYKVSLSEAEPESHLGGKLVVVDWTKPEFTISPGQENCITALLDNGMSITYILSFWDKADHPDGWQPAISRFRTQEEIQQYLTYVHFIVHHFRGRIQYYEIWNEPNNQSPLQWIQVDDYINLVKQTIPVIREEDPKAKVVVGGVVLQHPEDQDYLFTILKSDVMLMADVVSWHAMFGVSPEHNAQYYYGYPALVQRIKDEAVAHGFLGEYWADELIWRDPDCFWCYPGDPLYSNIVAAKYHARGIVIQLGLDLAAQVTGNSRLRKTSFFTIGNLNTVMAGNKPINLPVTIQSEATYARTYSFSLPNGDNLIALWNDNIAVDDDPGVSSSITISGFTGWKASGIDVLNGYEQELFTNNENGNLIISSFLLKDYPIIIRLFK
jgi:parallel beta-helix repeat protein